MVTVTLNLSYVVAVLSVIGLIAFSIWRKRRYERVGPWKTDRRRHSDWSEFWYQRPGSPVQFSTADARGQGFLLIRVPLDFTHRWRYDWRERFTDIFGLGFDPPSGATIFESLRTITDPEQIDIALGLCYLLGGSETSSAISSFTSATASVPSASTTTSTTMTHAEAEEEPETPFGVRARQRRRLDL